MSGESTVDFQLPEEQDDGLVVTIEVADNDGSFEDGILEEMKNRTIDPLSGIDILVEDTELVSLSRQSDDSFQIKVVVTGDD